MQAQKDVQDKKGTIDQILAQKNLSQQRLVNQINQLKTWIGQLKGQIQPGEQISQQQKQAKRILPGLWKIPGYNILIDSKLNFTQTGNNGNKVSGKIFIIDGRLIFTANDGYKSQIHINGNSIILGNSVMTKSR